MNFDPSGSHPACQIILATLSDVDRAFSDLNRDMNPDFIHVFLDKMQRYATKPDRALFLARYQNSFIAFSTIIKNSPAPENSDKTTIQLFKNYASVTGLMVLPEFRNQGVASKIVERCEDWTNQHQLAGIWLVTRQMADWYQRCFHFSVHGSTTQHGVKKIILSKSL